MNVVVQTSTAGVSLANGPVVARLPGATPRDKLRTLSNALLTAAGTDAGGYAALPPPTNNSLNHLGFAGLWPTFAPFRSFDPTLQPLSQVIARCTFAAGYNGIPSASGLVPLYECDYNSLQLPSREAQVEKVISPGVLGLAAWKEALWGIDFVGRIHDGQNNPANNVAFVDRSAVGTAKNQIVASDPPGAAPGTYIGSTPIEGMWGLMMVADMENAAEWLVSSLLTADGTSLVGFPSRLAALQYDYSSPLRWFPAALTVTEDTVAPFPTLTSLAIADARSRSEDLSALLLGHAMFFGMTDARNVAVGQRLGLQLAFDGDPFAADDGLANGQDTAHDRALAVLRVAFVDLDRMHLEPALGVLIDDATVSAGLVTRGETVTTTSLAHAVIALRQTLLSLNGAISQYGAPDPDPAIDAKGILNAFPIQPGPVDAGTPPTFSARVRSLLVSNATFVRDVLTRADGSVSNAATVRAGVATPSLEPARLDAQTAAIRALIEGFLVTGDSSFRDRARVVARRLEADFYVPGARMHRGVAGGKTEVRMTPELFGWLQSALREAHKTLNVQGDPVLGRDVLEDRIARANKLFLNGWDDLNGDERIDTARECLGARLQLAEQALTGELGIEFQNDGLKRTSDRDSDCILETDDAKFAAVLAREVLFHSP